MMFPLDSIALSNPRHNDVAVGVLHRARNVCDFDDGVALLVGTEDIALVPIGQHQIALSNPDHDDVTVGVLHRTRTVCGFDDGVAILVRRYNYNT